jgi:hypothetical protein
MLIIMLDRKDILLLEGISSLDLVEMEAKKGFKNILRLKLFICSFIEFYFFFILGKIYIFYVFFVFFLFF